MFGQSRETEEYGLQSAKVYVFSDSVFCLGKVLHILNATKLGKIELQEYEPRKVTEIMMTSKVSQRNSSGIFSQGSSLQFCDKIINLLSSLGQSPETLTGRILFMSMFNDISCEGKVKDNKQQCLRDADFVKKFAKRFGIGQWCFIGPGSEKKWYPSENGPQGAWDHVAEDVAFFNSKKVDIPFSVPRLYCKGVS